MEKDIWNSGYEEGGLIFQRRMPGGICIFLGEAYVRDEGGTAVTYYRILHPSEGLIEDPDYYYCSMKEAVESSMEQP
jgi:hypothetical protein